MKFGSNEFTDPFSSSNIEYGIFFIQIARLGPKTNIFGISTSDELLTLWDDTTGSDPGVRSVTISPTDTGLENLIGIKALGGLDEEYGHGIFVVNGNDEVYNVWWDGNWKAKEIPIYLSGDPLYGNNVMVRFGSYNGKVYMLEGWHCIGIHCFFAPNGYEINELVFIGDENRYSKTYVSSGSV